MKYQIELTGAHPFRTGGLCIHPGVYRVPEDMADGVAIQAIKDGAAVRIGGADASDKRSAGRRAARKARKGPAKKGPAPENKAAKAPEDKAETKTIGGDAA